MAEEAALEESLIPDDSAPMLVRHSAVMSVGTALSRITGFLRLSALAWALGIVEGRIADAYNVANTTPNIIYELALGGILSSVFVPVFVEWMQRHGRDAAWEVARRVLTIAIVVLSAIMVLGILLAPWIVRLYTLGIDDPAQEAYVREFASFFLRWFMPQIVLYGIGAVATGLLNAHRRFAAPMFAPILNNLTVIATFVAYALMAGSDRSQSGFIVTLPQKLVLAIGTTLGVFVMTAALWPSLRRLGFRLHWRPQWRHEAVRRIAHLAKWTVVYVVANQLGYIVVIVLSARDKGGYTAYSAAFLLFQLPYAIFAVSIFTALLPAMSTRWIEGDIPGFRELLAQGLRMTGFIVVPAALGYLVLAKPIVRLLLQHGVATARSTDLVSSILLLFALGLFSFSAFQLLLRAFYSMQDTRTPALVNIAAVSLNTAVNFVFFRFFGVKGLALGHATAYTFAVIVSTILIRRRLGGLEGRTVVAGLSRVAAAGAATAAAAWGAARLLGGALGTSSIAGQAVQVFGSVAAGLLVFVLIAFALRMEELDLVKTSLASRFRR